MSKQSTRFRFPLMGLGLVLLVIGLWAGLVRMGWHIPGLGPVVLGAHGAIMVSGVLGTVIGLERAVGMGQRWMYLGPLLTGLGGLALLIGQPVAVGGALFALGSVVVVAIFGTILRRHLTLHSSVEGFGAVLWLVGNLLWLAGYSIPQVVPFWAAYLILTVAGERLELSRLVQVTRQMQLLFVAIIGVMTLGLALFAFDPALLWRLFGASLVAFSLWLFRQDVARRTVRQQGVTRFIAVAMLSGYFWLGVGGLIALWSGFLYGGTYDAVLHSIFLGFIMAMIFGHAPIIFPAVLGVGMEFRPHFYGHLLLLHLSLVLRVGADLADWLPGQLWGTMFNVVAVTLFLAVTVHSVFTARRQRPVR